MELPNHYLEPEFLERRNLAMGQGRYYGEHHYDYSGRLLVAQDGPFRFRDNLVRLVGYHCWECWRI